MTDWKAFFRKKGDQNEIYLEGLYQAFKARMKAEAEEDEVQKLKNKISTGPR